MTNLQFVFLFFLINIGRCKKYIHQVTTYLLWTDKFYSGIGDTQNDGPHVKSWEDWHVDPKATVCVCMGIRWQIIFN